MYEYKISVCYFPGRGEVEATWEDDEFNMVDVTFPVDEETGYKLAEMVPRCVYHDALAAREEVEDDR